MLNVSEKKDFLMAQLFRAETLSSKEKLVALCLAFKLDDNGCSDVKMSELRNLTAMSRKTAYLSLRGLNEKINLEISKRGRNNRYRFPQWTMF